MEDRRLNEEDKGRRWKKTERDCEYQASPFSEQRRRSPFSEQRRRSPLPLRREEENTDEKEGERQRRTRRAERVLLSGVWSLEFGLWTRARPRAGRKKEQVYSIWLIELDRNYRL
ncbi:uncharacterized protein LOC129302048 [Prosopis cineraria]|uniref:uncharacterized protein LOC129302048 n=1 Tax=Prosopis cineraria TaxID=364024 RepID=UPI0024104993|nr:uncharacterized protein LOC129302048 [Prosopis cineraria]